MVDGFDDPTQIPTGDSLVGQRRCTDMRSRSTGGFGKPENVLYLR